MPQQKRTEAQLPSLEYQHDSTNNMFPKITFAWLLSAVCANNFPAFHAHHAPSAFVISSLASRSRAKSTAVHDEHCHPPFLPFTTMPHTAATNMIRLAPLSIAAGSNIDKSEYDLSSSANEKTEDEAVHISIEYCSACQWMLRGSWLASELLTTFAKESRLNSVTLIPKGPPLSEGGIFRISATMGINANILSHSSADSGLEEKDGATILLWDRKIEGRFPESKEVKQLIRDVVNPDKDLGHSDRKESVPNNSVNEVSTKEKQVDCIECQQQEQDEAAMGIPQQPIQLEKVETNSLEQSSIPPIFYTNNHVSIEYSTGAAIASAENGLYRANWYANELLSMVYARNAWWKTQQQTKEDGNIGAEKDSNENNGHDASVPPAVDCVTLIPNRKEIGVLKIQLNDHIVLHDQSSTISNDAFLDAPNLRDRVCQEISDGDTDFSSASTDTTIRDDATAGMMSDEEAENARRFFGVC